MIKVERINAICFFQPGSTLTIWGTDPVDNVDRLRAVIDSIGRDRIYLDVAEELANEIGR